MNIQWPVIMINIVNSQGVLYYLKLNNFSRLISSLKSS